MCLIISLRSTMVTGEKRSNIAVTAGGHGKVMEAEGVKDSFMFSILSIKNLKKFHKSLWMIRPLGRLRG